MDGGQFGRGFFTCGFRPVFCGSVEGFCHIRFVQFSVVRLILFATSVSSIFPWFCGGFFTCGFRPVQNVKVCQVKSSRVTRVRETWVKIHIELSLYRLSETKRVTVFVSVWSLDA